MTQLDIGIIGGGLAGLTAAYDLLRQGHKVTVYEARDYLGGLASGFRDEHWEWHLDRFYHHIFETDKDIITLTHEIGFGDKLVFPHPVTSIYHEGEVFAVDKPLPAWVSRLPKPLQSIVDILALIPNILSYKPLSFLNRIRYGLVGAYVRYTPFWKPLERVTADEWLRKAMGKRAYETAWQPLLMGKFGETYYKDVNMAWFWARLSKRSSKLGYFEGGFQAFLDALAAKVRELGGTILLDHHVRGVYPQADGRIQLVLREVTPIHDRVLATCSPTMLADRTPALPETYVHELRSLKSMGAVVMVLALKQSVAPPHYWINIPKREGFPFLAFVEHTNYMDKAHYGGDTIVYVGDYLPQDHPNFELSAEDLVEQFIPHIQRLNPDFDRSWIRKTWKFSERYAQPVPFVNHSQKIPAMKTPVPNLYMANMSLIYPWDRGTNYAVAIGRQAASTIMEG